MARRISWREFQSALIDRLTQAAQGEDRRALLGILSGQTSWLLALPDAGEIISPPPLRPVPLTQPWFAGMTNIRGVLYGVVDFSAFCQGEPTRLNHEARLLLIGTRHGMNCALLVSRILGLKNPDTLITVAETTEPSSRPSWQGEQLRDKESDLPTTWRRLHTAALLGDPGFLDITR